MSFLLRSLFCTRTWVLLALAAGCAAATPTPTLSTAPSSRPTTTAATTQARIDNPEPIDQPESPDNPVPFLTGEQEIAAFKLPKGFHVQLVAAEPMVQHPVAIAFDPDGRLWVCEMRGYMPNAAGTGENEPNGRISVLEDTNGDGKMDKSTVFLDGLVLPRAIGLARDGILVAVPPKLLFCRDTNRDGKCDEQTVVATDYGDGRQPEHQANGLMYGLDNWIYSVNHDRRYKNDGFGKWIADVAPGAGQWGITQDNFGRLFYNTNSDYLRGDIVPSRYVVRNPHYRGIGMNGQLDRDQSCWPAIPTAVNRGYRERQLRDGKLRTFTAACSPMIYRGGLFPREFDGNAFVCEPSASLIRRAIVSESSDLELSSKNAYDEDEFLTSTYERFRPVALANGPDGALYVVDMHHGLLQHKAYLTPYLKNKYLKRTLDQHLMTGRIFRIVPDNAKLMPRPRLTKAKNAELLAALSSPNGWWRDTAQRLLVERNDMNNVVKLKEIQKTGTTNLARIHALWTLEGMRRLDPSAVRIALADTDPHVRAMAIRAGETILASARREEVLPDILKLAGDMNPTVRLQFALTISEVALPEANQALARVLDDGKNAYIRDAAVTGLRGRELEFLQRLLADPNWEKGSPAREDVLTALSRAITSEANPKRVNALLETIASQSGANQWRQQPLLEGIAQLASGLPARKPIILPNEPAALAALEQSKEANVVNELARAQKILVWPGKPGYVPPPPPKPLTPAQRDRFLAGEKVYGTVCVQCHKPDGMGLAGLAPPLVGSEWALGPEERAIRIVLNGIRGPITVNGEGFNLEMPNLAMLSDEQIAGALTFVRRSWDNDGSPIEPETVAKIRNETKSRSEQWTERELLRIAAAPAPRDRNRAATGASNAGARPTTQQVAPSTRPTRPVAVESPAPKTPQSANPAPERSGGS